MISDSTIIDRLFERNQQALTDIKTKYGRLCRSISFNILKSQEDTEECENDTYLKVWNSVPPAKPDNLCAYICRIIRNISIDRLKYMTRQKRAAELDALLSELDESIPSADSTELCADDTLKCSINSFLASQSRQTRQIFIRRYFFCDSIKDIAKRYTVSESNVTTILSRARKKLLRQLEKDGINI